MVARERRDRATSCVGDHLSRREGIVARQKIRRVAANKVKARPTVFFAGDCALETRIINGVLGAEPLGEGVGEDLP